MGIIRTAVFGAAALGVVGLGVSEGFEKWENGQEALQEGLTHKLTVSDTASTSNTGCFKNSAGGYDVQDVDTGEKVDGAEVHQVNGSDCFFTLEPIKATGSKMYNAPVLNS